MSTMKTNDNLLNTSVAIEILPNKVNHTVKYVNINHTRINPSDNGSSQPQPIEMLLLSVNIKTNHTDITCNL